MILIKLKVVNFRQFYGEVEIKFSTDRDKNITLIHAENGVGKTGLLNSMLWCLYGKVTNNFRRPTEILTKQAAKEGIHTYRVELLLEEAGRQYLALRSVRDSEKPVFKIFEINKGVHEEVPNPRSFINNILPDDMADYFFFHGEGVSNINKKDSAEKFRRAVRVILGFQLAENAIKDLKEIRKGLTAELADINASNNEQKQAIRKKKKAEDIIERNQKNVADLEVSKDEQQTKLECVLDQLRASSDKDASRYQKEIDNIKKKMRHVDSNIKETKLEKQQLISKYGPSMFGHKLGNSVIDFINESTAKGTIPAPYDEQLVHDLVERKSCICGRKLELGTTEYKNVVKLIESAGNAIINDKLYKARSIGSTLEGRSDEFLVDLTRIEKQMSSLDGVKRDLESDHKENAKLLSDIDVEDVRKNEGRKKEISSNIYKINSEISQKKHETTIYSNDLGAAERILSRYEHLDVRLKQITHYQSYIDELIQLCIKSLDEYESGSKSTIAATVEKTLQDFSRNDFHVKVGDDFSFHLVGADGAPVAHGDGENLLLNLAFVSGLIEFAQLRSGAKAKFFVTGSPAPFVIDAPFGELDVTYKRATAKFLPQRTRQLVLFLSSSHWKGDVDEVIKEKIGSEYVLISKKIVSQGNKPDDRININGKEYIQSLYGQEVDATQAVKVR